MAGWLLQMSARQRGAVTGPRRLNQGGASGTSMKRKEYDDLAEATVADRFCKVVRARNKIILLFAWEETAPFASPFTQACEMLSAHGETASGEAVVPLKISVDVMKLKYESGDNTDYLGCVTASRVHEIVVYEDGVRSLSHLKEQGGIHVRLLSQQT
ncbi:unnamed protein product [Arctia plantaginis]|uniref:Uncharacterized protein n=1 Tax=Arctia plantaginis TaxID=874455 RepID=A0A8S0ZH09_ARCPL|nr:unnamed protein product [Arctia plantaginis]